VFDNAESICASTICACKDFHLWDVTFLTPDGLKITTSDIYKFVRDNPFLFNAEDLVVKATPQHKWCNADSGLHELALGRLDSWKGWQIFTYPKTFKA
jgi:hypothetical protein